jgi:hypothetical protein
MHSQSNPNDNLLPLSFFSAAVPSNNRKQVLCPSVLTTSSPIDQIRVGFDWYVILYVRVLKAKSKRVILQNARKMQREMDFQAATVYPQLVRSLAPEP